MIRLDSDDEYTLHLTRGDRCTFKVYAREETTQEECYFPAGCHVTFAIVPAKGYTEGTLLRKTVLVPEDTTEVEFTLTEEDTKIGEMIDKKVKYWYNVVVNDDITIIGSDEDGEKAIYIYPEVGEGNE